MRIRRVASLAPPMAEADDAALNVAAPEASPGTIAVEEGAVADSITALEAAISRRDELVIKPEASTTDDGLLAAGVACA